MARKIQEIAHAPVAQLDRVFGYEPKGRGFESLLAYQGNYLISSSCLIFFSA